MKYSNGAWINGDLDFSEISGTGNVALLNANQTFTGTVLADTQAVNDNSTKLSTTAFVQNEIAELNLGTASQNDTGDFSLNASAADLSDVSSIANIQDGNVLAWVAVNNRLSLPRLLRLTPMRTREMLQEQPCKVELTQAFLFQ